MTMTDLVHGILGISDRATGIAHDLARTRDGQPSPEARGNLAALLLQRPGQA